MPTKPSSHIDWTDGAASKVTEPTGSKKLLGWVKDERPPFQFMNYLFFNTDEWVKYFEEVTDFQFASIDRVVSSTISGADADLQTAINNATAGDRILIAENASLATTVSVSAKDNLEFIFKPGVTYSDGGAGTGLSINNSDGIKVRNGRMTGFTTAIDIDASSNYVMIRDMRFQGNTNDFVDNGGTSDAQGNINE